MSYKRYFLCKKCFLLLVYTISLSLSIDFVDPPPMETFYMKHALYYSQMPRIFSLYFNFSISELSDFWIILLLYFTISHLFDFLTFGFLYFPFWVSFSAFNWCKTFFRFYLTMYKALSKRDLSFNIQNKIIVLGKPQKGRL